MINVLRSECVDDDFLLNDTELSALSIRQICDMMTEMSLESSFELDDIDPPTKLKLQEIGGPHGQHTLIMHTLQAYENELRLQQDKLPRSVFFKQMHMLKMTLFEVVLSSVRVVQVGEDGQPSEHTPIEAVRIPEIYRVSKQVWNPDEGERLQAGRQALDNRSVTQLSQQLQATRIQGARKRQRVAKDDFDKTPSQSSFLPAPSTQPTFNGQMQSQSQMADWGTFSAISSQVLPGAYGGREGLPLRRRDAPRRKAGF